MAEYDPWAPPGAANSYEHSLSPHEQRMWETCAWYDRNYSALAQLVESQQAQLVRHSRQADLFGTDATQLYEGYAQLVTALPGQTLGYVNASFDQANMLLAQHGPDAALWAEVLAAAEQPLLPYDRLQKASSPVVERAMRIGLDGFVWNRAMSVAHNPLLLEQVAAEASSPALGRLLQQIFDDRLRVQLEHELNRPRLRAAVGGLVLNRLSPRSQQAARLGSAWALHRAGKRLSAAAATAVAYGTVFGEAGPSVCATASKESDADWLLGRLPSESTGWLRRDPVGLQWVINSVRKLRAQAFVCGRLVADHEILAGVRQACAQPGAAAGDDIHRAHYILTVLMQGNPYGRLPF